MKLLKGKTLAIIIPVYNEAEGLSDNFHEIQSILLKDEITCQYLFVDDGSVDETWAIVEELSVKNGNVKGLKLARNFGKELALCAGLDQIDADYYILMDADLQHPPKHIKLMLELMELNQVNVVEGVKSQRGKESLKYKLIAKSFYKVLKFITGLEMDNSSDFKLMDRQVVNAIRTLNERNLFFRGLISWVGFKKMEYQFDVDIRKHGNGHFSTPKLMLLAFNAILSHTSKPLYIVLFSGLLFLLVAIMLAVQTLINYFTGKAFDGFSTVILLLLVIGSMIMLSLGIIGVYISRIYEEVKGRPRYVVEKKL